MNDKRTIHKLSSVIDLLNHDMAIFPGKRAIRVRYDFNGITNNQEFTILNNDISKESADSIFSWLNNNVKSDDIISLKSNELDMGNFHIKD